MVGDDGLDKNVFAHLFKASVLVNFMVVRSLRLRLSGFSVPLPLLVRVLTLALLFRLFRLLPLLFGLNGRHSSIRCVAF